MIACACLSCSQRRQDIRALEQAKFSDSPRRQIERSSDAWRAEKGTGSSVGREIGFVELTRSDTPMGAIRMTLCGLSSIQQLERWDGRLVLVSPALALQGEASLHCTHKLV